MALFKILKGQEKNLPANKTEGWAYVTTDEGNMYVDVSASKRVRIGAHADKADVATKAEGDTESIRAKYLAKLKQVTSNGTTFTFRGETGDGTDAADLITIPLAGNKAGLISNAAQTIKGEKTFANGIKFPDVTSTTYPAVSAGLTWSGSTDGAKIYYEVQASDKGMLIIEARDDTNAGAIFRNSSSKKEVSIIDGLVTGAFKGNLTGTADYADKAKGDSTSIRTTYIHKLKQVTSNGTTFTLRGEYGDGSDANDLITIPNASASVAGLITNAAQTIAGAKTFNGGIVTRPNSYKYDNGFGINLQNSDIIGANSIYFNDVCDNSTEGIHYIDKSGTYRTLWATGDGILYWSGAHAANTGASTNYVVVHSGNFNTYDDYITAFTWTNGTTAGPTATITRKNGTTISVAAIPSASGSTSGIITTGAQTIAGEKTLTNNLRFSNITTGVKGIIGTIADNDYWRVVGGANASNQGYLEIATADDANEPIYVRQYSGVFATLKRTLTLLDASGNTRIPGSLFDKNSQELRASLFIASLFQKTSNGTTFTFGGKNTAGTELSAITIPNASTSVAGLVTAGAKDVIQAFSGDKTFNGCVRIKPTSDNGRQGLRIGYYDGLSMITLGAESDVGYFANSWHIADNNGTFYITHNGSSSSSTGRLTSDVNGNWEINNRLGVNGKNVGYTFYVNGSSYLNGTVEVQGITTHHSNIQLDKTVRVRRNGRSASWNQANTYAMMTMDTAEGWSPFIAQKATNGWWTIGHYNTSGFTNDWLFGYLADGNVSGVSGAQNTLSTTVRLINVGGDRMFVTSTNRTQHGSNVNPVYVSNTGQVTACTYELKSTVEGGSANRLPYYSTANKIAATTHYANTTQIGINENNVATIGSHSLYVNGTTFIQSDTANSTTDGLIVNNGRINVTNYGYTLRIGNANNAYTHFETSCSQFYFNKQIVVNGHLFPYTNNSNYNGTSSNYWNRTYSQWIMANPAGSSTDGGITLYKNMDTNFGIFFRGTGNMGTHGSVTADLATYFTMSNTTGRGWIFRNTGTGNVASISAQGHMTVNGSIGINGTNVGYKLYVNGLSYLNGPTIINGTNTGAPLILKGGLGSYREGLRIIPYGSWSDIVLGGNDITEASGISTNSWFIGNNNGNFYITRNGSTSGSSYIANVGNYWALYPKVGINGTNTSYNFYVNGSSYFNGNVTHNGIVYFANGTTYAINNSGDATLRHGNFRGTSDSNTAAGNYYYTGALEIRESNVVGSAQSAFAYAPRIGFHWGGRIAASLSFHSDGIFYFRQQNGTSRARVDCLSADSDLLDGLHSSSFLRKYNTNAEMVNTDALYSGSYIFTHGDGGDGGWPTGTKPSGSHNGVAILHTHTHSGNYYTQLALDTSQNYLWIRSANNTTTFGAWAKVLTDVNYAGILDGRYVNVTGDTMTGSLTNNARMYCNEWIQFNGGTGLYWPNNYGTHLYPNASTTHGNLTILGSKSGYTGINLGGGTNRMTIMDADGVHKGLYREASGWLLYFNGDSNCGIRTSSIWTTGVNIEGSCFAHNGYLFSNANGQQIQIGPQNNGYIHYTSSGAPHWFNTNVQINGTLYWYPNTAYYWNGNAGYSSTYYTNNWFRSYNATGWYNETYGGGIYMSDTTWIRTYNNKSIFSGSGQIYTTSNLLSDGGIYGQVIWANRGGGERQVGVTYSGGNLYLWGNPSTGTAGIYDSRCGYILQRQDAGSKRYNAWFNQVWGAVWNDYAEYRKSNIQDPGRVVFEDKFGICQITTKRMQPFAGVVSDTFGFCQGETKDAKTPLAVAGRVLVYPYRNKKDYNPGDCVCAAPEGTVDIMTREEIMMYPDRIVGTVSEIPDYEEWGETNIKVNERIWIKVK